MYPVNPIMDEATKSEGIEALIYPAEDLFKRLNVMRNTPESVDPVYSAISDLVAKVNKDAAPYARISKITILEEPLEMTTTKKVKRNYNK
jgi:long-chain acyl-CoA synthetase